MEEDWPPPEARARAALWEAERWLRTGDYAAAGAALDGAVSRVDAPDTARVARGLRLLAAAGYRHRAGDPARASRLLESAKAQLAPYLPVYEEVELAVVVDLVDGALRS